MRLYDVVHSENRLMLVFEYLDQDLKTYLDVSEGGVDYPILKSFMYQLLRGTALCRKRSTPRALVDEGQISL